MTTETDLLPLPEPNGSYTNPYDGDDLENYASACVARATAAKDAEIDALRTRLEDTVRDSTNKIEALREEIGRLLDSREREGDRLDWLLARLPGDVIRDLVGEMSCTSDVGEWRDRIDKAARFKPTNP